MQIERDNELLALEKYNKYYAEVNSILFFSKGNKMSTLKSVLAVDIGAQVLMLHE